MIHTYIKPSLLSYNTFKVDVRADQLIEYDSTDDLIRLVEEGLLMPPVLHIGKGSNLLFVNDYRGTVLRSRVETIEWMDSPSADTVRVKIGAGVVWDDFVEQCVRLNIYGVENLSLIPGTVGAAAVQNIGAYGAEIQQVIDRVETISCRTGQAKVWQCADCHYDYRHSIFKDPDFSEYIVTYVWLKLSRIPIFRLDYKALRSALPDDESLITLPLVRETVMQIRRQKLPDPELLGNAGSFFMNPIISRRQYDQLQQHYPNMPHYDVDDAHVKVPAAWLIEQCGWKGKARGKCAMYDKQALVLVNLGGATGTDIVQFAKTVQASVQDQFGITISPEVKYIYSL